MEAQRACKNEADLEAVTAQSMPVWFNKYVIYRFNLYDRAGEMLPQYTYAHYHYLRLRRDAGFLVY